jgi:two-component system response regulator HydG
LVIISIMLPTGSVRLVATTSQTKSHEIWNAYFINQIIDSMADGVFTMDTAGCISSWNPAMERIRGYSAEEVLGKTCKILQFSRCFGKKCPANLEACGPLRHRRHPGNATDN